MSDTSKPQAGQRSGGNRRPRQNNGNRNRNNNRNRNRNRNRKPKPLVLNGWQKFLKAIGLLNEDKLRAKQREQEKQKRAQRPAAKSNTRVAKSTGEAKPKRTPEKVPVASSRLYVGNLSYDASEYDIEDLFKGVGTVKKVEIIYNRNTHKSKGYGFVEMLNTEEAARAVEVLHDQHFMGRKLVVNGAKSRKESDKTESPETSESAE